MNENLLVLTLLFTLKVTNLSSDSEDFVLFISFFNITSSLFIIYLLL
jgi:hypothetical protein